ncbi:MAG TPA: phospholipase D-like domain-containing protein [Polyangia bacterium]|jgi:phosphatidylserine/phosphatidylglycerophosphate/cardiolipin synthase-like enzyme
MTVLALAVACAGLACGQQLDARSADSASPVRVLVEPDVGPDAVRALLAGAQRALSLEMYLLTDAATLEVLGARRAAGVDVRILLEPHPYQADGANQAAFDQLAAAGVDVRWTSPQFALTHAKVAVIDHARLAVLTLNLTRAGLAGNREYAVIDDDPRDVAAADALLAADATGLPVAAPGAGRVLASPETTRPALAAALERARSVVAVETEELSDPALVGALADARARGCAVSIALPGSGASAATTGAARRLAAAGVVVRLVDAPQIHAKAVVADDWLYVGSANLTAASLDANREVGLGLRDPAALALVAGTIADDLARGRSP